MLQNAQYSVWFRTPAGEGLGIISLMDGDVSGGDNISSYTGTYVQQGDKFTATLSVKRHTQGSPSTGSDRDQCSHFGPHFIRWLPIG
jgi:hypothetical protein